MGLAGREELIDIGQVSVDELVLDGTGQDDKAELDPVQELLSKIRFVRGLTEGTDVGIDIASEAVEPRQGFPIERARIRSHETAPLVGARSHAPPAVSTGRRRNAIVSAPGQRASRSSLPFARGED